jgi:hypothetical protein
MNFANPGISLWSLKALPLFMRLSLQKGAQTALSFAACRKSGGNNSSQLEPIFSLRDGAE